MVSLKNRSKGFTIIELLIVIVVIAILATLVIVTFTGIQQKARNSQRQTDINAVDTHLEAYFAENGHYPSLADLQDPSWVKDNMKGFDPAALVDPNTPKTDVTQDATGIIGNDGNETHYGYNPTKDGTNACGATDDTDCKSFKLTAHLEGDDNYVKSSNT